MSSGNIKETDNTTNFIYNIHEQNSIKELQIDCTITFHMALKA